MVNDSSIYISPSCHSKNKETSESYYQCETIFHNMGAKTSKGASALGDEDFVQIDNYAGSYNKDGKRHGQGAYYFDNGDIYDGEWRKGRKEGYGKYVFANGERNIGWFYRDEYVGKQPNEKLRKKMRKKRMLYDGDEPLKSGKIDSSMMQTETSNMYVSDSEGEADVPKLKDPTLLDLRREESVRRQKHYRTKYNIPDRNQRETTAKNSREQEASSRAKWDVSRTKSNGEGRTSTYQKDPKLLTKQEERLERQNSKRFRESIRAKYNLRS